MLRIFDRQDPEREREREMRERERERWERERESLENCREIVDGREIRKKERKRLGRWGTSFSYIYHIYHQRERERETLSFEMLRIIERFYQIKRFGRCDREKKEMKKDYKNMEIFIDK